MISMNIVQKIIPESRAAMYIYIYEKIVSTVSASMYVL